MENKCASSKTNPLAIQVPPGTVIEGRFLLETIAMGRYSTVFRVEDILDDRQKYCLKAEYDRASKVNYLHQEIAVLHKLAERKHMARLFYCERCDPFSFMLITLFGKSIWILRQNLPNHLVSPGCAARIAVHTLYQIKQIHEIGFILRDLKIGDMLVGLHGRATKMVFLVDFGMCRTYIRKENDGTVAIRPPREKAFIRGVLSPHSLARFKSIVYLRYCSPRVHKRLDVCRADDLWSLVYVLIDLTAGLPWRQMKLEASVAERKENISMSELFKNCPENWIQIMEHIQSLSYESRPDYKFIYDCLQATLVQLQVSYSDPWDWDLVVRSISNFYANTLIFSGENVILEANSVQETEAISRSHSDRTDQELQTDRDECSLNIDQSEADKQINDASQVRNPLKDIVNILQKSSYRASIIQNNSKSPTVPIQKQSRIIASEYDPAFPTTNPQEFENNDIGI
ncbi:unnamed protein product [Thelazia callipaeda]|uniref:Protein kinase domain-containing protein n=1 Tax=Thelazia callipaeda TaxID=103827 RepID=A0A0N5DBC3_THECL|nr:unnamed protein product [Thelazia callipaeda]